jgi:hypothetical protein
MIEELTVRLRVVDESGDPVEGAFVSVLESTVAFPEIALVTDRHGMVKLMLPKGRFVIGANDGDRRGELTLLGDRKSRDEVTLRLR